MPKFLTSDKISRRVADTSVPIQSYDASSYNEQAARSAQQVAGLGSDMVNMSLDITKEKEEKAEKEKKINDAMLESQMKSSLYRAALENDTLFESRSDYESFGKEDTESVKKITSEYLGKFSNDSRKIMELYVKDHMAGRQSTISKIARARSIDRNNAIEVETIEANLKAYSLASNDPELRSKIKEQTNNAVLSGHIANNGSKEDYALKMINLGKRFGKAHLESMPNNEKLELLQAAMGKAPPDSFDSYYKTNISIESGGDPKAQNPNSSAKGLHQWVDSTAKEYGLLGDGFDYRGDVEKEKAAFKKFTQNNKKILQKRMDREPTNAELYLAHQQGAGGASALLESRDEKAIDTLTRVYSGDRSKAKKSIIDNGGKVDMTSGEFADLWINKYNERAGGKTGTPIDNLSYKEISSEFKRSVAKMKPELSVLVNDAIAELSDTGKTSIDLDFNKIQLIYGDDAQGVFDKIESAAEIGNEFTRMKTTSISEDIERLNSFSPSGEGYAQESRKYQSIQKAIEKKKKLINSDPTGYVAQNFQDVNDAFQAYREASENINPQDPKSIAIVNNSFQEAIRLSIKRQEDVGVNDPDIRVISKDHVNQIKDEMGILSPNEKLEKMQGLSSLYGDYWVNVQDALIDAGVSEHVQTALSMNRPDQSAARARLMQAEASGKEFDSVLDDKKKKSIKDSVFKKSNGYYGTFVPNERNIKRINAERESINKLAISYMVEDESLTTENAVKAAYDDVVGKKYTVINSLRVPYDVFNGKYVMANSLRVPKEYNATSVKRGLSLTIDIIDDNREIYPVIEGSVAGTTSDIIQEQYIDMIKSNPRFTLSADEKHVHIVDTEGNTVHEIKDGKLIDIKIPLSLIEKYGMNYTNPNELAQLSDNLGSMFRTD